MEANALDKNIRAIQTLYPLAEPVPNTIRIETIKGIPAWMKGAVGISGTNGADGQDGATGATGPAGMDGQDGVDGQDGADGAGVVDMTDYSGSSCQQIAGTTTYVKVGSNNASLYSQSGCSSSAKFAEVSQGEAYWASSAVLVVWYSGGLRALTFGGNL